MWRWEGGGKVDEDEDEYDRDCRKNVAPSHCVENWFLLTSLCFWLGLEIIIIIIFVAILFILSLALTHTAFLGVGVFCSS